MFCNFCNCSSREKKWLFENKYNCGLFSAFLTSSSLHILLLLPIVLAADAKKFKTGAFETDLQQTIFNDSKNHKKCQILR
jgi:hypothetical protein